LTLGLQHFGFSLLDPMLFFMCTIVHTNELVYVPAMLSVAKLAYFRFKKIAPFYTLYSRQRYSTRRALFEQ
jgi:hypothetical protein